MKDMVVPGERHYMEEQKRWVAEHSYFMGIEANRPITNNQSFADFRFGNDHAVDAPNPEGKRPGPSPEIYNHVSPRMHPTEDRRLFWEEEFRIWYYHEFIKSAIDSQQIIHLPRADSAWIGSKFRDVVRNGLHNLLPITEETILV